MKDQFQTARLKLTAYYVLIIFFISSVLSGLYYYRTCQILDLQSHRIQRQVETNRPPDYKGPSPEFLQAGLKIARQQLTQQILSINLYILILSALASYFLASHTLKPIQKASDKQKQFIADAAHELKTPITALKSSLEVNLMDKKTPKSAKTILQDNLLDINSLESLTKNLLTLARFDSHSSSEKSKISLNTIIDRSLRHISPLAKTKKINIKKSLSKKSAKILANQDLLTELFIILLDNAIKYGPSSSTIHLSTNISSKQALITIKDQGIGIAPKDIPHIFDRFYRADQSRSSQIVPGHGLGLSLAKTIVSYHQGKIAVKSKLDSGSTFTVTLPLV